MAIDTAYKRNAALVDQYGVLELPHGTIDSSDRQTLLGEYPESLPVVVSTGPTIGDIDLRLNKKVDGAWVRMLGQLRDWITAVDWEVLDHGGYGQGSFTALATWEQMQLNGGERLDVWYKGQGAYRGFVGVASNDIADPEFAKPTLYGLMERLNGYTVTKKYAFGTPQQLIFFFTRMVQDCAFQADGSGNPERLDPATTVVDSWETVGLIGPKISEFDARGKTLTQALNQLIDMAPGLLTWGCDVVWTQAGLPDRIYLRARPSSWNAATGKTYVVGGDGSGGRTVSGFAYPRDMTGVVNALRLTGGKVLQPNLLPNADWGAAQPASERAGNNVQDFGFENKNVDGVWHTYAGSPTIQFPGNGGAHGNARTGQCWLELDTPNEGMYQIVPVINSQLYRFSCWARLETGSDANALMMTVVPLDVNQNPIGALSTPTGTWNSSGGSGSGGGAASSNALGGSASGVSNEVYQFFSLDVDWSTSPSVAYAKVILQSAAGTAMNDGVLVDDVGVYPLGSTGQPNWLWFAHGAATALDIDWAYSNPNSPIDFLGRWALRLEAHGISNPTNDYVEIYNAREGAPTGTITSEHYTLVVFWQAPGATTNAPILKVGIANRKSDNSLGNIGDNAFNQPSTATGWQAAYYSMTSDTDMAWLQCFVSLTCNDQPVYIGGVMLVEGEMPAEVFDPTVDYTSKSAWAGGYWAGADYERVIDVEDALFAGGFALDTATAASITNYGRREKPITQALVTDITTALAYCQAFFEAHGTPRVQARLSVLTPDLLLTQDGDARLVNLLNAPTDLWPSRVRYSATGDMVTMEADLGNERPDMADLLSLAAQRASAGFPEVGN